MNTSNYGALGATNLANNAYEFLINANISMINSKKNRSKGSNIDSRCSNKEGSTSVSNSVLKSTPNIQSGYSQMPAGLVNYEGSAGASGGDKQNRIAKNNSNTVMNNTSSTTICSNRRQGGDVVLSAKKNSY